MGKISFSEKFISRQRASLTGKYTVDVLEYTNEIKSFLITQGAADDGDGLGLHFPGCKPVKNSSSFTRIFFNDTDKALVFSIAYGHYITNSNVKEIRDQLEEVYKNRNESW